MKGKLIVFEGMDGSGKATQSKMLFDKLVELGYKVRKVSFPDYDDDSSALVKMYLGGEFGDKPDSVNCYAASAFFAVDRVASYLKKWRTALDDGEIVLLDRYTTSNMVHQTSKLPCEEWDTYLDWLCDFEFKKMGLPAPDLAFYLRVTADVSQRMLEKRYQNDESKKDIHEKDVEYLHNCEKSGMYAAKKFGWKIIECLDGDSLRPVDDIHSEILKAVLDSFDKE